MPVRGFHEVNQHGGVGKLCLLEAPHPSHCLCHFWPLTCEAGASRKLADGRGAEVWPAAGNVERLASGAWAGPQGRGLRVQREAGSEPEHPGQQTVVRECMLRLQVLRRWMEAAVVGGEARTPGGWELRKLWKGKVGKGHRDGRRGGRRTMGVGAGF